MARSYSREFKAKAVRLAQETVELEGCSMWAAATEIGEKLDIPAHTLHTWLKRPTQRPSTQPPTETPEDELKRLRKEVRELRRANEILKTASAFFAAELDRPTR